ncbi:hypothetical protein PTKIN_Ptkin01aG0245900 [Pterospermum kingtungense]
MLIRRCVFENIGKDDIQKLFPNEVLPELQRLLTLLLQKFQKEWRADIPMDEVSLPRLKARTWNMATQDTESLKLQELFFLSIPNPLRAVGMVLVLILKIAQSLWGDVGGIDVIKKAIEKLGLRHKEHIAAYGEGN